MIDKLILVLLILILLYKYGTRNHNYWAKKQIPYIPPTPFIGNFLDLFVFRKSIGELVAGFYRKTKAPYIGIFAFNTPRLVLRSPELIKTILVRDFNNFDDRSVASPKHDPLCSNMLFMSKNPEWKAIRVKMTPIFTSGKLKNMMPLIHNVGVNMRDFLRKNCDRAIDAKELSTKYATDVIAICAFAIDAHSFKIEDAEFRNIGKMVFDFNWSVAVSQLSYFFFPKIVDLFYLTFMNKRANDFLRNTFWSAIEKRADQAGAITKAKDLIDAIIELRKDQEFCKKLNFEGDKVVSQAVQFFLAGFETTSSTIAFALYELSRNQDIQNKLREEVKSYSSNQHDDDSLLSYDAIRSMKYLNMCICETLRKYPSLPILERQCRENYRIPGTDDVIEKGTAVYISLLGLHYDEEYFPNPHEFNPERFSDENVDKVAAFSYIPFGQGPRNCIGERFALMSTKLALINIISEFKLESNCNAPERIEFEPKSFFLGSKKKIQIVLRKL